jgi:hypothetical protein
MQRSGVTMKQTIAAVLLGLLSASIQHQALAEGTGDGGGHRMQGGGINVAPRPAVYEVLSINPSSRTVRLRAADGRTAEVFVGEDIYDIAKLKQGDRIQVDFVKRDQTGGKLKAASVWPVKK